MTHKTQNRLEPVVSPHNEEVLRKHLLGRKPVMVEGGPGIGKSLTVKALAVEIYGEDKVEKIDITEDTEVRHLLGEHDLVKYFAEAQRSGGQPLDLANFFVEGKLTAAARRGSLLIIEELDRAGRETLFPVLFDAIEYKKVYVPETGQTIDGSENGFNIIITVNRFTDIGTVSLPKALLRRPRCVRFYDPSKELGINRWQAVNFESRIVMANLAGVFARNPTLGRKKAERLIIELLYKVLFPLRSEHCLDEQPSPSETAMWFVDMIECEGDRLLADHTTSRERLEICLRYRGALAKTADDDARFIHALSRYFASEPAL